MRNSVPVFTEKEIVAILKKKAKGTVTAMAKKTKEVMQYVTKENLYDKKLVRTKKSAYKRTGNLYRSISVGNTETFQESFSNGVSFSEDYLMAHKTEPIYRTTSSGKRRLISFGSYTDIYGDFVGDSLVNDGWIEEGTERPSIVPRKGAYIYERTADEIENIVKAHGFDAEFTNIGAEVSIERYR